MAKPIPLFQRGETAPLAPAVAVEIAAAENTLAELENCRGTAALSAMTGGDTDVLAKLETDVAAIKTKLHNLRAAYRAACELDARHSAEALYRRQLSGLGAFEKALADRDAAVFQFCAAAKIAAESYRDIFELSDAVAVLLPEGTQLPSGFSAYTGEVQVDGRAQAAPLDHLAAHEFYRHSGITRPGQGGALPGSKPFSLSTLFRSDAIEPWEQSTRHLSAFLVDSVKNQIERDHQIELRAIEIATEEAKVA